MSTTIRGVQIVPVDERRDALPDPAGGMSGAPAHRFPGTGSVAAPMDIPDAWSSGWILAILLLAMTATLTVALHLPDPLRQVVSVAFALVAPGMAIARLARVGSRIAEVSLGLMLSVAISGLVAGALLGIGRWDATLAVVVLAVITFVALELDPRIPSRAIVWHDLWRAAHGEAPGVGAPGAEAAKGAAPTARPPAPAAEPLPPPPVAVVRRGPRRAPVSIQPPKPGGKRQALGEDPLDAPAMSRHLRTTIDGVIDDLAARRDVPPR